MERWYYVYFMQSSSRRALYIGVTSDLEGRVWQHKTGMIEGFTSNYNAHRLVYFERFSTLYAAIAREKQLKGWTRAKKNWLVERVNPKWKDLSEEWFKGVSRRGRQAQGPSTQTAGASGQNRIGRTRGPRSG